MDSPYFTFFRFFGLRENPFNVNPDPHYLYLNQRTRNVLSDLQGAIQARKGLMVLTGDVGTGKTTLLNYLIQRLQKQRTPTAFIFNPRLQVSELFDLMLGSFAIPSAYAAPGSSLSRLSQWLLERYRMGSNAVLIIDEAQGLPAHVLEEIRVLLNQETPHEKLLQIVLCGQPELETALNDADHRQIRQRISLRCKMAALTREETGGYMKARLCTAGAPNATIFTAEAVDAVHHCSRGIPRVMNLLCEHALIRAYVEQIRPVGAPIIEAVARQLELDDATPMAVSIAQLIGEESAEASLARPDSREDRSAEAEIGELIDRCAAVDSLSLPVAEEGIFVGRKAVAEVTPIRAAEAMRPVVAARPSLRIVSSTPKDSPKESNVTEISRDTIETSQDVGNAARVGRSSEKRVVKDWIAALRIGERARASIESIDWDGLRKRAEVRLREVLASRETVRGAVSRWSNEGREIWESLVHWLQQPMTTVKVQRRLRH